MKVLGRNTTEVVYKLFHYFSLVKILLLAVLAFVATGTSLHAQALAEGKFTLPFEARMQNKVLPAGDYTFSIESVNSSIHNISSIASGYHPVLMTVNRAAGGPRTMFLVRASSQNSSTAVPAGLAFQTTADGEVFRSLFLEDLGLVVDFNSSTPKNAMHPPVMASAQPISSAKTN